ncbi:hypothetical protein NSZ01_29640 [Nocardioides szechwanensis]|nr:hypothetical protein NSZ01_29640 [Nocardioides szechwanensis]
MRGNLGVTNLTRLNGLRQPVIHRLRESMWRSIPAGGRTGLTLWNANAYRWPVTGCRPVPHVHGRVRSFRGWAVPAEPAHGPRPSGQALPIQPRDFLLNQLKETSS